MSAVGAAVLAAGAAVFALATHHVITAGVLAAGFAVTASTCHVITAGLAAGAASSATGCTAVGAACGATGLASSAAGSTAALASTTDGGHVGFRGGVGGGVHLYIWCKEIIIKASMKIDSTKV